MTQLINYKAVCRTAPATPGLLIIYSCLCISTPDYSWVDSLILKTVFSLFILQVMAHV